MQQHIIDEGKMLTPVELGHKLNVALFNKDAEEAAKLFAIWLHSNNLKLSMDAVRAVMSSSSIEVL